MPKPIENKPSAAYCFDVRGRMAAVENVTGWSLAQLTEFCRYQKSQDRRVVVSAYGRAVCGWCKGDLGSRPGIEAGRLSHGICPECSESVIARAMLPAEEG